MSDDRPLDLIPRHARGVIREAITGARVVLVLGARQTGKSTLTRQVADEDHPADDLHAR